jgi:outer membrane protein OmpA-like peptidoglycan-associated protein
MHGTQVARDRAALDPDARVRDQDPRAAHVRPRQRGAAQGRGPIIAAVADTLLKNPDILRIEIAGHASKDDASTDAKRLEISDRRAAAVRDRLVALGVATARLSVQGYGDTQPVDKHATALAESKNRRVDFVILQRKQ